MTQGPRETGGLREFHSYTISALRFKIPNYVPQQNLQKLFSNDSYKYLNLFCSFFRANKNVSNFQNSRWSRKAWSPGGGLSLCGFRWLVVGTRPAEDLVWENGGRASDSEHVSTKSSPPSLQDVTDPRGRQARESKASGWRREDQSRPSTGSMITQRSWQPLTVL